MTAQSWFMVETEKVKMMKIIRVSSELIDGAFQNGKRNYEISNGLPAGYRLENIIRDSIYPDVWIFLFSDNEEVATYDEITPLVSVIP